MQPPRTRICILIPGYHSPPGGAESQLEGLLARMDGDRFAPFVLTRRVAGARGADRAGTAPVIRLPAPVRPSAFFFSALRYLWKHRREYDVIDVHALDSPALAGALIKHRIPGKTLILRTPRLGEDPSCLRLSATHLGRKRLRFVLAMADAVIPACPDATKSLQAAALPPERIANIPNGVDADYFRPAVEGEKSVLKRSFGIAEDAFVGIVVARLVARHHVEDALAAWKRVCESHSGAVLIVVGNGPDGPRLSDYARAELDRRAVIFTGDARRDEVARLLRTADVYLSYSRPEAVSNAMLEAMSAGLPVVAARSPGVDCLVRHTQFGFLFDPTHPMDGADYLLRLAEDPDLLRAMAITARCEVESHYSFERIAQRLENLYLACSADAPGGLKPKRHPEWAEDGGPQDRRRSKRRRRKKKRDKVRN
jgi:glycosyltransferase involved in cell wall biosynthesis